MTIPPFSSSTLQNATPSKIMRLTAIPSQAQTIETVHSNAYVVVTNLTATSLSGTYVYGSPYDISNWDGVILELTGNGLTGSMTGLQALKSMRQKIAVRVSRFQLLLHQQSVVHQHRLLP